MGWRQKMKIGEVEWVSEDRPFVIELGYGEKVQVLVPKIGAKQRKIDEGLKEKEQKKLIKKFIRWIRRLKILLKGEEPKPEHLKVPKKEPANIYLEVTDEGRLEIMVIGEDPSSVLGRIRCIIPEKE